MSTEAPPAPVAPTPVAPAAPNPSPRSPVTPGSTEAHLQAAKAVWPSDPSKAPMKPAAPAPAAVIPKPEAKTPAVVAEPAKVAAVEPAKVDAVVFPEDKLAEPVHEGAKAGWKELKAIAKQERSRAAELESQIAELKKAPSAATPANTAEIDALRADLKASQDRLLVLDVQNHPDFHRQFIEPVKKAFAESEMLLKDNGVEGTHDLNALLTKPRVEFAKTVSELASKMNAFDAQTFTANMRQAYQLQADKAGAMQNAGALKEQLAIKSQQQQRSAFEAEAKENLSHFQPVAIPEGVSAETKAQLEAWNSAIPQIRKDAEAIAFGKVDERGVARMSLKAAALDPLVKYVMPGMRQAIQERDSHIAELTRELTSLRGQKAPPAGGGDPAGSSTPPANESIEQSARRVWSKR